MGKAKLETASDGLLARVAPTWTEEKLRILAAYLNGFAPACKSVGGWYALDLFAGGGLNISETSGGEISGSALIALEAGRPMATQVLLCEKAQAARIALEQRTAGHGERRRIFKDDSNIAVTEMLEQVPRRAPAFAFLDPEGADVHWSTVRQIAEHKASSSYKVEQLILFPTHMGFVRLLNVNRDPHPAHVERVDRMFGNERWREIYERRRRGECSPAEAADAYLTLYAAGLRDELGYEHVQERLIRKEPRGDGDQGPPMYFLVFATDNDAGDRIMSHCFDKKHLRPNEELGQLALLKTPVAPRQRRSLGGALR